MSSSSASAAISPGSLGRNSCSGGSSSRMVTGYPSIARKIASKSDRCIGSSLASAARRPSVSDARIISRMAESRSPSKNMCSVRQSPMPSAPKSRPRCASAGVSALTRTRSCRIRSAHRMSAVEVAAQLRGHQRRLSGEHLAGAAVHRDPVALGDAPAVHREAARCSRPPRASCAPATHGLPIPRATTAACDVIPPRAVRIALASTMPWKSSGEVSRRTRITDWPARPSFSARSASKTAVPHAAPGEAGRPVVSRSSWPAGRGWGGAAD